MGAIPPTLENQVYDVIIYLVPTNFCDSFIDPASYETLLAFAAERRAGGRLRRHGTDRRTPDSFIINPAPHTMRAVSMTDSRCGPYGEI